MLIFQVRPNPNLCGTEFWQHFLAKWTHVCLLGSGQLRNRTGSNGQLSHIIKRQRRGAVVSLTHVYFNLCGTEIWQHFLVEGAHMFEGNIGFSWKDVPTTMASTTKNRAVVIIIHNTETLVWTLLWKADDATMTNIQAIEGRHNWKRVPGCHYS